LCIVSSLSEQAQFDYLIIGAGSAGCVLANRLSVDPSVRVAVLEAGPRDASELIRIPAAVGGLLRHPVYNWNFKTAPQAQLSNRVIAVPRGKVVGGTSSINGMVYTRGHPHDFDDWASAGNRGWSYREVLPYFIRSENNEAFRGSPYHGLGGPMNVISIRPHNPLVDRFVAAAASLGYSRNPDFNGETQEGFGPRQATIRGGRRESMATAFLWPALRRGNVELITDALVRRVLLDSGRAVGVEFEREGQIRTLKARAEIILCGGAIGSPQLLLRSGIGNAEQLQALGITPQVDLAGVGRNLQDHFAATIMMRTRTSESYGLSMRALPRGIWTVINYALRRRGALASNVFEAHGFIRTRPELDRPDVQIIFVPAHRNASGFPIPFGHGFGINIALLRPVSRGSVSLTSPDPRAAPLIDPAFLSNAADLAPLMSGFVIARAILNAPAFASARAHEILPGPHVRTEQEIERFIRESGFTVFHPVGTCRMGSEASAVVDPALRVRGTQCLRVVDASVFPTIVGGNTNAAVVMVAEKAADLIRGKIPPAPLDLPSKREDTAPRSQRPVEDTTIE
jgi:choline dehydrogenase-like flavoprotein